MPAASRRDLLCLAALGSTLRAANPRQTIRRVEVFTIPVNHRGDWLIVRVTTSGGITGIGDASQGHADAQTLAALRKYVDLLSGGDLFGIERLRTAAMASKPFGRSEACALSAIEQCLWDIRGKLFDLPVSELLGGRLRGRIRNYANINRSTVDRSPRGFAAMAERAVKAGFDAIKMAPWDDMPHPAGAAEIERVTQLGIDRAAAVRAVLGPSRDLLLDAHSHFSLEKGLELARRAEFLNLYWLEEVTPAEPAASLARINREARMRTAGGESIFGVEGFYRYIAAQCADIIMPDIKYCGGVFELKKVAAMCEAAGLPVSPHGPASPVGNAAAAQVCATLPNFLILEFAFGEVEWRSELTDPPELLSQGVLEIPARPGLGYELNEKLLARRATRVVL
ncbi:MAG: mandelate racemase/muconate lactonizing enzyme family protein [Bryobacteraceae bacterium]